MSAERGWIIEPQPASDPAAGWVAKHRDQGHHPYPAPTADNPECWECDCPDTAWTAIWRILTPEQIRQKYAHLKNRPMPDHIADMRRNRSEVAEGHDTASR